jgi:hypothetical protein
MWFVWQGIILCFLFLGRDRPPGMGIVGRIVHEAEIAATDGGKWMTGAAEGANTATASRGGGKRSGDAVAVETGDDPAIGDGEGNDPESGTVPGWWITEELIKNKPYFGLNLSVPRIICFLLTANRDRCCFLSGLCLGEARILISQNNF